MKQKLCNIIMLLAIIPVGGFAQKPLWNWAASGNFSASGFMSTNAIATDNNGNTFVCGKMYDPSFTSGVDMFVTKYDASGNLLWQRTGGSIQEDAATSITTDASGNVYVTGYFAYKANPPFEIDTAYFDNNTIISKGHSDAFVCKYNALGTLIWVKGYGGALPDDGQGIKADNNGHLYITGNFALSGASPPEHSTAVFDTFTITSIGGNGDIFVARLDTSGNVQWIKTAGSYFSDFGYSIAIDTLGNVYAMGTYSSSYMLFDSYQLNSVSSGWVGGDIYMAKYDSAGIFLWAKTIGATNTSTDPTPPPGIIDSRNISISKDGSIYVAGCYSNCKLKFGNNISLNPIQSFDIFVSKFDNNGNPIWAKNAGGNGEDYCYGVAADIDNNVYITGSYGFGMRIGADTLIYKNAHDLFIAKYNSSGNPVWAIPVAGYGSEEGVAIACDNVNTNTLYVTGSVSGASLAFDGSIVNPDSLNNYFVAKASGTTGINDPSLQSNLSFHLYPNPSTGSVTVQLSGKEEGIIMVSDMLGRSLYNTEIRKGQKTVMLNLDGVRGCYYVTLKGMNNSATQKLIIQ